MAASKKKQDEPSQNPLVERCTRCKSANFSISKDKFDVQNQTRYCTTAGCGHVWMPKTQDELKVEAVKNQVNILRKTLSDSKDITDSLLSDLKDDKVKITLEQVMDRLKKLQQDAERVLGMIL